MGIVWSSAALFFPVEGYRLNPPLLLLVKGCLPFDIVRPPVRGSVSPVLSAITCYKVFKFSQLITCYNDNHPENLWAIGCRQLYRWGRAIITLHF